jgi:hypothetical protein
LVLQRENSKWVERLPPTAANDATAQHISWMLIIDGTLHSSYRPLLPSQASQVRRRVRIYFLSDPSRDVGRSVVRRLREPTWTHLACLSLSWLADASVPLFPGLPLRNVRHPNCKRCVGAKRECVWPTVAAGDETNKSSSGSSAGDESPEQVTIALPLSRASARSIRGVERTIGKA